LHVRALLAAAALVVLAACNPIVGEPTPAFGGQFDLRLRYDGPAGTWLEFAITRGPTAPITTYFEPRVGPQTRPCVLPGGSTSDECDAQALPLRQMDDAGSGWLRLVTVWPGEIVRVSVLCFVDLIGCQNPEFRFAARTVDETGARVGALTFAAPAG
jgi:hypothetical protein